MAAFDFPNSPSTNDTYTANGVTFQWNGSVWTRYSASQGAQGSVGAQGAQGAVGSPGAQGAVGAQGAQGHQGAVGAQGAAGAQGAQGHQGTAGSSTTINGNTNNYVVTATGTANTLQGEANLTFNGTTFEAESGSGVQVIRSKSAGSSGDYAIVEVRNSSTTRGRLVGDAAVDAFRIDTAGGASTPITFLTGSSYSERLRINSSGQIQKRQDPVNRTSLKTYSGEGLWFDHYQYQVSSTYRRVADIVSVGDGSWGSILRFHTMPDGGSATERLRISETGNVSINTTNTTEGVLQVNGDITAKKLHGGRMYGVLAGRKFDGNNALGGYALEYASGYESPYIVAYNNPSVPSANNITFGSLTTSDRNLNTGLTKLVEINATTGNTTLKTGNLVIGTSGKGIDFSVTGNSSGSMTNELFDDYEEGTWTPSFNTSNSSGTLGSLSYNLQEGRYVKIGSTVYIEGALRTTNVANNGNGTYDIAGLPFTNTTGGSTGTHGIIHCGSQHSWTNAPNSFDPIGGATYMRARGGINVGDSTYTNGYTADFNTGTGSKNRVYFSGTYSTDF